MGRVYLLVNFVELQVTQLLAPVFDEFLVIFENLALALEHLFELELDTAKPFPKVSKTAINELDCTCAAYLTSRFLN